MPHPEGSTLLSLRIPFICFTPHKSHLTCTFWKPRARPPTFQARGSVSLDPFAGLLGKPTYRKTIRRNYLHPDWEEGSLVKSIENSFKCFTEVKQNTQSCHEMAVYISKLPRRRLLRFQKVFSSRSIWMLNMDAFYQLIPLTVKIILKLKGAN